MPTGHEALVKGLDHEWPRYLGYFVSFAFIGGVWIAHSNMTRFRKAADADPMRLNLTLLAVVFYLALAVLCVIDPDRLVRTRGWRWARITGGTAGN